MTVLDHHAAGSDDLTDAGVVPRPYRTATRVIGAIYLAGMVLGIGGDLLITSVLDAPDRHSAIATSGTLVAVGAVLWLVTVLGDAAHGVLMFPILKRHSERAAVGYLAARIMDAVLVAVMTLLIVAQIPLGRGPVPPGGSDASLQSLSTMLTGASGYAYEFGMTALGVSGLILCSAFLRWQLIPRSLAWWGLVGYAILLGGSLLQILGFELNTMHTVPGGLWELFIGGWLIVKGFTASALTR